MPSPSVTVRLSPDLKEIADHLAKKHKYADRTALIVGLLRYAALVDGDHVITQPMSELSKSKQDKIDARLLRNLSKGKFPRGQYLKHLLKGVDRPQDLGIKLANMEDDEE